MATCGSGSTRTCGTAWYWACLVGEGRPLVTVIDHEVPLPPGRTMEIRSEGLWADHTVETPLDHMTLGCEAFATGVDDPAEVYGSLRGDRVPFGLDLEWETDGGTYAYPHVTRYEIPCRVHGEILVGDEQIDFDGWGQRDHSWGVRDWWTLGWLWTAGRLEDGTRFHANHTRLGDEEVYATGYQQPPGGPLRSFSSVERHQLLGDHGFPLSASLTRRRPGPGHRAGGLLAGAAGRTGRPDQPLPPCAVPLHRPTHRPDRRGLVRVEPAPD